MSSADILMFHRIIDDMHVAFGLPSCYRMRGTAITLDEFERALSMFERILSLDEVEQALELGDEIPPGAVLTFDDGYREHLDVVADLLASRSLSATFFIATGLDGSGRVAPVDAWYWLLDHATKPTARVPMPSGVVHEGRIDSLEGKEIWVSGEPKKAFLESRCDVQAEMLQCLSDSVWISLPEDLANQLYMSTPEWETLVGLGMRIGAHGVTHRLLPQLDDSELRFEVESSVNVIRQYSRSVAFAYPNGDYDNRVVSELLRAGVASSVTCEQRYVDSETDRMRLPRYFVTPWFPGSPTMMS